MSIAQLKYELELTTDPIEHDRLSDEIAIAEYERDLYAHDNNSF